MTLGEDVNRCHRELIEALDANNARENLLAEYEYHARQLIRAFFAFVEGITFSAKIRAVADCTDRGIDVSPQERFYAAEVHYVLDDQGRVVEQRAHVRLGPNVRFVFALLERARGVSLLDPTAEWWSCFKKSIRVRDRLMHPKMPADVNVSPDEIIDVLKAKAGFQTALLAYPPRARKKRRGTGRYKARRRR